MRAPRRFRRWLRENPEHATPLIIGVVLVAATTVVLIVMSALN